MPRDILDCLQNSFEPLCPSDIDRAEQLLGVRLPEEYRNFLLSRNGGWFKHNVEFRLPEPGPSLSGAFVQSMCGIFDYPGYGCSNLLEAASNFEGDAGLLPIANLNTDDLCIGVSDSNLGRIFFWDNSADVEEGERQLYFVAANLSAFFAMLRINQDLEKREETIPVFQAAERGDPDAVREWLDQGGNVDARNAKAQTLLMCAARNCWPKVASLLVSRGAGVNLVDESARSALYYAAAESSLDIGRLLIGAGADVNFRDGTGKSVLAAADEATALRVMDALLGAGAVLW